MYFIKFQRKICFSYTNFVMKMMISQKNNYSSKNIVVPFQSKALEEQLEKVVSDVSKKYQDKMNFKILTEKNLLKDKAISIEKKLNDFFYSKKTTMDEIFTHYHDNRKSNSKIAKNKLNGNTVDNLIKLMEPKFYDIISKFTNEFVDKGRNTKVMSTSSLFGNKNKSVSLRKPSTTRLNINNNSNSGNIKKEQNNSKIPIKENVNLDDSYVSVKTEIKDTGTKRKERNYFGYNKKNGEEVQHVYRRINDLNKLEFEYFNKRKATAPNSENPDFSDIYYNLKKKFFSKTTANFGKNLVKSDSPKKKTPLNIYQQKSLNKNQLNANNVYKSIDTLGSTRLDTKSNYNYLKTEESSRKTSNGLNNKKKLFLQDLMKNDFLIDNEIEINSQIEKQRYKSSSRDTKSSTAREFKKSLPTIR